MIFRNKEIQDKFDKDGYVKVKFLDQEQIAHLLEYSNNVLSEKREVIDFAENLGYYISIFDNDIEHKREADALINGFVEQFLAKEMIDYEPFYSNFMIKYPGDGVLEAHQDFNLVDESIFTAFNLWCPLVNTTPENGGLHLLPGSHKISNLYRGPNIPFSFTTYTKELVLGAKFEKVDAGECLIFDHKTIHYSGPNTTSQTRFAIQSVLKPKAAQPILYHYNGSKANAHLISKDFVLEYGFWSDSILSLPILHSRPYADPLLQADVQNMITGKMNSGKVKNSILASYFNKINFWR
jgi:hypothetical protein